jgi:hypothetical protein
MLGVLGCGEFDDGGDSGGVTTDPSGGEEAESGVDGEFETGASGMTSGGETEGGQLCDALVPVDSSTHQDPSCSPDLSAFDEHWGYLVCKAAEPGDDCQDVCAGGGCGVFECPGIDLGDSYTQCPPYFDDEQGMCCTYVVAGVGTSGGEEGRPFRPDEGPSRFASSHEGARVDACEVESLPAALRAELADYWRRVALAEHASIASFARFVGQLVRFAAPPELVRDAMLAAADEVRHAEQAFALASRYAGRRIEPGPLHTADGLAELDDLARAVRETVHEGCLAETLAAHEAALLAEHAGDAEVRRVLATIAADEARHAGLAWRFVAWALARAPELRGEVTELLRSAHEQGSSALPRIESSVALAHGRADAATRRAWQRHALARVVQPCAAALACA